eukprot:TRINITY_DN389_c2_g1_i1.p1 TRINITY_DN389_c2_g1~~TRINITY_DN389_c2_g1_i1.p1  ORF type:complete len:820 (-),score=96.76 TRINITY_DN389_c2_g1_i1:81-2459(-)
MLPIELVASAEETRKTELLLVEDITPGPPPLSTLLITPHHALNSIEADATAGAWRPTHVQVRRMVAHLPRQLNPQVKNGGNFFLIAAFFVSQIGRYLIGWGTPAEFVNTSVGNVVSLVVSGFLVLTSRHPSMPCFSFHALLRAMGITCITGAGFLAAVLATSFNSLDFNALFGCAMLSFAVLFSRLFLSRSYDTLAWLAFVVMSLSTVTYVWLFVRAHLKIPLGSYVFDRISMVGVAWEVLSLMLIALGGVLSERFYKSCSPRMAATFGESAPFYVFKLYFDISGSLIFVFVSIAVALAIVPASVANAFHTYTMSVNDVPKILCGVAEAWLIGLIVRRYSFVGLILAATLVSTCMPLLVHSSIPFEGGPIVQCCLVLIIAADVLICWKGKHLRSVLQSLRHSDNSRREADVGGMCPKLNWATCKGLASTYGSVLIFIVSDVSRQLLQQEALGRSNITPLSLNLASYTGGIAVATAITMCSAKTREECWQSLKMAYSPQRMTQFLPSAVLFAVATALTSMAYAFKISAALNTALGYTYLPVSAFLSYIVLGKYYALLEWCSLAILTFAAVTFGLLQNAYAQAGGDVGASYTAMCCVVMSATSSALAGLTVEKFLKHESAMFHIQKVSMDLGSLLATFCLLPVIGLISSRSQDAFWKERLLNPACTDPSCFDTTNSSVIECVPACACCGSGVFVGWNWLTWLALVANLSQSWLTGIVIKQFSTVLRAIAQSMTILFIYFIAGPLLDPGGFMPLSLTLVAFIVPLSVSQFMVSVSEMKELVDAAAGAPSQPAEVS